MSEQEIIIEIDLKTAALTFETNGFEGADCLAETAKIKEQIGTQSALTMKAGARSLKVRAQNTNRVNNGSRA